MNIIFIYKDEQELKSIPEVVLKHPCIIIKTDKDIIAETLKGLRQLTNKTFVLVFSNTLPFLIMDIIKEYALELAVIDESEKLDINQILTFPLLGILDRASEFKPE